MQRTTGSPSKCIVQARHKVILLQEGIKGQIGLIARYSARGGYVHQPTGGDHAFKNADSAVQEPRQQQGNAQRHSGNKARAARIPTQQTIHGRGALLKELLEQLEAEQIRIAALLIRQGVVKDHIGGREDCVFGQVSRQLARFQEEVQEIFYALLGAQAKRRRVRKQELRKTLF